MAAKYPLAMLIDLRGRRLQAAQSEEKHCKLLLSQALNELESKKQELADYLAFRDAEIERRYREILNTVKTQNEIAKFNSEIGLIYEKENLLRADIVTLDKKVQAARQALTKAKEQVTLAFKAKAKLESHRELWLAEQRRYLEYKADLELEDFRAKKPAY
ncbi:MAG: type III secretion protein [Candidatus Anaerobiospirillum merdipullorum]|uniref:Type III secretion protein n=1 Tax=Candidatus Anaerobiospirillum merdipullorum TaxID=2838450 RepID=A0A9E2KMR6_9GAMM|nr:type III secretion protein [Candidatus Anaerobiospirillum merdipullorum]